MMSYYSSGYSRFTELCRHGVKESEVKAKVLINSNNELNEFRKMKQGPMKGMEEGLRGFC